MRLQLLSDLHLETEDFSPRPAPGAELLVLGGDIDSTWAAFERFANWPVPVLMVAGNHEFDAGKDELLRVMGGGCRPNKPDALTLSCPLGDSGDGRHPGARFPHFAANVVTAGGKTLFPPSVVKTVAGVRVGFIGAVTKITPTIVVPSGVAGLRFDDEAESVNRLVPELRGQGLATRLIDALLAGRRHPQPLIFLPYLQGERVPYWNPALRGAILGLGRQHGATDLAFAVLEGVAFLNRIVLERAEAALGSAVGEIRFGGGAAAGLALGGLAHHPVERAHGRACALVARAQHDDGGQRRQAAHGEHHAAHQRASRDDLGVDQVHAPHQQHQRHGLLRRHAELDAAIAERRVEELKVLADGYAKKLQMNGFAIREGMDALRPYLKLR